MTAQVLPAVADNRGMSNLKYAAECPLCHTTQETVWFRTTEQPDELVCRDHAGHPLYEER